MAIIFFLIVLSVLVIVHEAGHFIAAKKAGVRVDEFGLGFPPKAFKLFRKWNTDFTLNWIPFGGFVKIFGENYDENQPHVRHGTSPMSDMGLGQNLGQEKHFTQVSKVWQVIILAAGVTFNVLLAWLLFSTSFLIGMPYSVDNDLGSRVSNAEVTIISVLPESPAEMAGLKSGDVVVGFSRSDTPADGAMVTPEALSSFISESDEEVILKIKRGRSIFETAVEPSEMVVDGRYAIGINMDMVGTLQLPFLEAFWEGAKTTYYMIINTVKGLSALLFDAVRGRADLSQVTGPVGIVGIVGEASILGFVYILTLTAFISINLAVINLLPFPSLDGGRILFVIIEVVKGKPVSPRVFNAINSVSFALLILVMLLITVRDVSNLF